MEAKVMKIKVLGNGSYGVMNLVKTIAPVYDQIYVVKSANEKYSSFLLLSKDEERFIICSLKMLQEMILEVLLDVHEKGFIHSGLKPSNILAFRPQYGTGLPTLKIADFGLKRRSFTRSFCVY
ncbi:hypothetical protein Godav_017306 [Gossypium davidsonii]|uniref:Protein kinase domain-containing protein n=2 Tax=Gossypium TaxID=3633 RepID=A0A7J8QU45_GOSDV|nr:hypothetical protein [Gossypium davidsonii]MBA0639543.1 hypothetical protein [Gossypium klotzschianum]